MTRALPIAGLNINARVASRATIGRKAFIFDGTTKGLTLAAVAYGAKAGSKIKADFGGGMRAYIIEAAPHDDRAGGYWAVRA